MEPSAPPPDEPSPRPKAPRKSPLAAAAFTVGVAGVGVAILLFSRSGASGPKLSTPDQLEASAKAVGSRHPDAAADIEPLSTAELARVEVSGYAPTGLWILEPVGVAITDRPIVRWLRVDGARTYDVRVRTEAKELLHETTTDDHLAFPARNEPLVVGARYVVTVRATFAEPRIEDAAGRSEFTVLPVPHRAAWRTVAGDVESNEPAAIRDLLITHFALRKNLFGEALRRADAWSTAHPGDPAARPLLEALARVYQFDGAPPPYAGFSRR